MTGYRGPVEAARRGAGVGYIALDLGFRALSRPFRDLARVRPGIKVSGFLTPWSVSDVTRAVKVLPRSRLFSCYPGYHVKCRARSVVP